MTSITGDGLCPCVERTKLTIDHSHPELTRPGFPFVSTFSYWCMQFDCSPITLAALNAQYRIDPRVVRWTNIRLGNKSVPNRIPACLSTLMDVRGCLPLVPSSSRLANH